MRIYITLVIRLEARNSFTSVSHFRFLLQRKNQRWKFIRQVISVNWYEFAWNLHSQCRKLECQMVRTNISRSGKNRNENGNFVTNRHIYNIFVRTVRQAFQFTTKETFAIRTHNYKSSTITFDWRYSVEVKMKPISDTFLEIPHVKYWRRLCALKDYISKESRW